MRKMANLRLFRPRLYKLCLFVIFFIVTGVPQSIWSLICDNLSRPEMAPEERIRVMQVYDKYLEEKIFLAKKKIMEVGSYRSRDYFYDLESAEKMRKELGIKSDGLFSMQFTTLKEMVCLRSQEDYNELEKAKQEYKDFMDPGRESREETFLLIKKMGWAGVAKWVLFWYLKLLPLAFVLFIVWAFENAQGLRFPKPGRLILITLAYPFFIARVLLKWLKKEGRDFLVEAELRRTKQRLFTYFSENEIRKIREFGASMLPLNLWRKRLASLGLRPRHSLAAALAVTLIFAFLPTFSQAEAKVKKDGGPMAIVQFSERHLARMDVNDVDLPEQGTDENLTAAIQTTCSLEPLLVIFFRTAEAVLRLKPTSCEIDHVPLSVVRFLESSFTNPN